MGFEVGKKYKRLEDPRNVLGLVFTTDDNTFVVSEVDGDGDAWSTDCTFLGQKSKTKRGWCVASPENLEDGSVILVEEGVESE